MTSRERVRRALTFQSVDQVPVENGVPGLEAMLSDVITPPFTEGQGFRERGVPRKTGCYTDAWGCVWECGEDGVTGEVKSSPIVEDWSNLEAYQPPFELITGLDLSKVNAFCQETDRFVIPMWGNLPNLFERMQHLRGTEQLLLDIAYAEPPLLVLRDMVHDFYRRYLQRWLETDVDAIHIQDDWGTQQALLISPEQWRTLFKPCYKEYCDLAHQHGKLVVMHSDGVIQEILPDLIEIGVNAINSQLFCMNIEELGARFHGKIAFWGEIDRQTLLTQGTVAEVRAAVRRVAHALMPEQLTGVVGQCFWGKDHILDNMRAVYDEWERLSRERKSFVV